MIRKRARDVGPDDVIALASSTQRGGLPSAPNHFLAVLGKVKYFSRGRGVRFLKEGNCLKRFCDQW